MTSHDEAGNAHIAPVKITMVDQTHAGRTQAIEEQAGSGLGLTFDADERSTVRPEAVGRGRDYRRVLADVGHRANRRGIESRWMTQNLTNRQTVWFPALCMKS